MSPIPSNTSPSVPKHIIVVKETMKEAQVATTAEIPCPPGAQEQVEADQKNRNCSLGVTTRRAHQLQRQRPRVVSGGTSSSSSGSRPGSSETNSTKKKPTLREFKSALSRLEARIQECAGLELELLNRAKALREKRYLLTRRYTSMSKRLMAVQHRNSPAGQQQNEQQQQLRNDADGDDARDFDSAGLPPMLSTSTLRKSNRPEVSTE